MSIKSTKNSKSYLPTVNDRFRAAFGDQYFAHHPLAAFTPAHFGGAADHIVIAKTTDQLVTAASIALFSKLPYVAIGGGTGVLVSDIGFPGLVIINQTNQLMFDVARRQIVVESGVGNDYFLNVAASRGWGGLEFLGGVPGTLGGAVATNAGRSHSFTHSFVREVVLFTPRGKEGEIITVRGSELDSGPYEPLFKAGLKQPPIILSIRFQLAVVNQRLILQRLREHRRGRSANKTPKGFGYVFTKPLKSLPTLSKDFERLRGNEVRLDPRDHDQLICQSEKTSAQSVKDFISKLKVLAQKDERLLAERLHFLGYWPDEETTDPPSLATNAEGFPVDDLSDPPDF